MIVRWGLDALPERSRRDRQRAAAARLDRTLAGVELPVAERFHGAQSHAEKAGVEAATEQATEADGLVALGGGSAIDTAKAVSAATGLPLVSIPTTYAGAEWTSYFGTRDASTGTKGGGGGAHLAGIVYEPSLTLDLPRAESGGTAMNALAHCAEALYVVNRNDEADAHALAGAQLIAGWLPDVLARPRDHYARTELLRGAAEAGAALAGSGLALGHAMAQALGGRYGLPHGALNAICLPPALRYNEPVAAARDRTLRAGDGLERRGRQDGRSWRGSAGSRGCATSASRATSWGRWPRRRPRGPRCGSIRVPPGRMRSKSSFDSVW